MTSTQTAVNRPGGTYKRVLALAVDNRRRLALVRGWGARELVLASGHKPLWSASGRGWVIDARHAPDVEALAQHERRLVSVREVGGGA